MGWQGARRGRRGGGADPPLCRPPRGQCHPHLGDPAPGGEPGDCLMAPRGREAGLGQRGSPAEREPARASPGTGGRARGATRGPWAAEPWPGPGRARQAGGPPRGWAGPGRSLPHLSTLCCPSLPHAAPPAVPRTPFHSCPPRPQALRLPTPPPRPLAGGVAAQAELPLTCPGLAGHCPRTETEGTRGHGRPRPLLPPHHTLSSVPAMCPAPPRTEMSQTPCLGGGGTGGAARSRWTSPRRRL